MSNSTGDRNDAGPSDLLPTLAETLFARAADVKRIDDIERAHEAGELSREEFMAALIAIRATRFPAGYTLGPCPPWCVTDHAKRDDEERAEGLRGHSSEPTAIQCVTDASNTWAKVGVDVMDNLDTGVRDPAAVHVASGDALSPANARALAEAILAAAALAEEWNR